MEFKHDYTYLQPRLIIATLEQKYIYTEMNKSGETNCLWKIICIFAIT